MAHLEKTQLQLGYIPLLDCVALLWAKQRGFFEEVGLDVSLVKEASWASLRDRLAFGFLDAAHCLSAMLPAAALAQDQLGIPLQTPLVLSYNSAFISLSQKLCYALNIQKNDDAAVTAHKFYTAMQHKQQLAIAHVFKQSIHHYCLREWLALANPDFAKHVQLRTLPPPYMVEAISNQLIEGFCVGEPWNTQAEIQGYSQIIATGTDIIPRVADKVLAVTQEWAISNPNTLSALVQAIEKAQDELKRMKNFEAVWQVLVDYNIIRFPCSDSVHVEKYYLIQSIIRGFIREHALPQVSDFIWLTEQMQKWDDVDLNNDEIRRISHNCVISPKLNF